MSVACPVLKTAQPGEWQEFMLIFPYPVLSSPEDVVHLFFANYGKESFFVDDLQVRVVK